MTWQSTPQPELPRLSDHLTTSHETPQSCSNGSESHHGLSPLPLPPHSSGKRSQRPGLLSSGSGVSADGQSQPGGQLLPRVMASVAYLKLEVLWQTGVWTWWILSQWPGLICDPTGSDMTLGPQFGLLRSCPRPSACPSSWV